MNTNCNLELRLLTPSVYFHSNSIKFDEENESPKKKEQLTIFYNGMVATSEATQLQAKAILSLAKGEMEERCKSTAGSIGCRALLMRSLSADNSPTIINNGHSMKRSLQRFLEKRRKRAQAQAQSQSPYPTNNIRHQ